MNAARAAKAAAKAAKAERPSAALGLVPFAKQVGQLEKLVRTEIADLARRDNPVIVGPFLGEVGFELLYWIPLVRWVVREYPELEDRLVVVSRGGTAHWYGSLASRYVDVLSVWSVEEFHSVRRSVDKQREVWEVEHDLLARLKERESLGHADVLHPSLLYRTYYLARKIDHRAWARSVRRDDSGTVGLMSVYEPLGAPEPGPLAGSLPDDYVAVRFYFRPSFPDNPENRRFADAVTRSLASNTTVVLLNNRLELDDHADVELALGDRVVTLDELMEPTNNLHIQTIALSRARAFIGTYGGLAYLAASLNLPSLAFSALPEHTHPWHLDLAQRVFEGPGWGSLVALRPEDLALVDLVTGGLGSDPRAGVRPWGWGAPPDEGSRGAASGLPGASTGG